MYKQQHRVISMLLLLVMLITTLPLNVFADTNAGGSGIISSGSGDAKEHWSITGTGSGYRFTLYWAESKAIFENPATRHLAERAGATIDVISEGEISSTYLHDNTYTTGLSTVYNLEGEKQIPKIAKVKDAEGTNKYKLYNGNVPFQVPTGGSDRWVKWFQEGEGDNIKYKNIDTVTRAMGNEISNEDFKKGIYRIVDPVTWETQTKQGHYEMYIEPVFAGKFGGQYTLMSSRYAMMWERMFDGLQHNGKEGLNNLGFYVIGGNNDRISSQTITAFRTHSNQVHLIDHHASIDLGTKKANIHYTDNSSFKRDLFQWKGGDPYMSMGAGVITPPAAEKAKSRVLVSYVRIVDYKDGEFFYETIRESEEIPVKYQSGREEEGLIEIEPVRYIEQGRAIINDVVTSTVDTIEKTTEAGYNVSDIEWETGLEPTIKNKEKIVEEEEVFGRLHGVTINSMPAEAELALATEVNPNARVIKSNEAIFNISEDMNSEELIGLIFEYLHSQNKQGFLENNKILSEIFKGKSEPERYEMIQKMYPDIFSVGVQPEIDTGEVVAEPGKAPRVLELELDEGKEVVIEPSKVGAGEAPVVAHLRYVVIPESTQYHVTINKVNGVELNRETYKNNLRVTPDDPTNVELDQLHDLEHFKKWYIIPGGTVPDLTKDPLPPKKPGTLESETPPLIVPELTPGDNVVVVWEKEDFDGELTDKDIVPEWRISKYKEEMDWGLQAHMGMTLAPDTGHGPTSLSPSGNYNFHRINPNEKRNDDSDTPTNKKFSDWLHSKTIARGSDTVSHGKPSATIEVNGDLNLVKSTALDGINLAKWLKRNNQKDNFNQYDIKTDLKGNVFGGSDSINKQVDTDGKVFK